MEGLIEAHSPWHLDQDCGSVPPDDVPVEAELQAPSSPDWVRFWTAAELCVPGAPWPLREVLDTVTLQVEPCGCLA